MIKAWFMSLLMIVAFAIVYWSGVLTFLSYDFVFYIALGLVVIALGAAVIILGNPFAQGTNNDKDKD